MSKTRGAIVASPLDAPCSLANTCVNELVRVAIETYDLEQIDPAKPERSRADFVFFPALSYNHLNASFRSVRKVIDKEATLVAFVFDAYFSDIYDKVPPALSRQAPLMANLRRMTRIYTPFLELMEPQKSRFGLDLAFLPIGVDAVNHAEGLTQRERWIDVNGYGRQPDALVRELADRLNTQRGRIFHYTRHMNASMAKDPLRHRQLFWKMLNASRIALAYSPEACDPMGRFPCSFVGQRWFESLAAGCVIAGVRPRAAEADQLLDWPDATIELPPETDGAVAALLDLLEREDFLEAQSRRNTAECLKRHDWRLHLRTIAREFPMLEELRTGPDADGAIAARLHAIEAV